MACGDEFCGGVICRVKCGAFAQEVRSAGELAAGARVVVGGEDGDGQFFAEGFEFAGEFRELFADAGVECGCVEVEALAVGRIQDDDWLRNSVACVGDFFCGVGEEVAKLRDDVYCGARAVVCG